MYSRLFEKIYSANNFVPLFEENAIVRLFIQTCLWEAIDFLINPCCTYTTILNDIPISALQIRAQTNLAYPGSNIHQLKFTNLSKLKIIKNIQLCIG